MKDTNNPDTIHGIAGALVFIGMVLVTMGVMYVTQ